MNEELFIMISVRARMCICFDVDLARLGPVGLPGEQTAIACALEPGHLSAEERLQWLEEPTCVSTAHGTQTHTHKTLLGIDRRLMLP